jgi:ABC-type Fe3+-siderophore transport system permease subunit
MASTVRLYIDASYAVGLMAFVGIVSGFAAALLTSDTERSLQIALAMFALTGAFLAARLWRMTRKAPRPLADDPAS